MFVSGLPTDSNFSPPTQTFFCHFPKKKSLPTDSNRFPPTQTFFLLWLTQSNFHCAHESTDKTGSSVKKTHPTPSHLPFPHVTLPPSKGMPIIVSYSNSVSPFESLISRAASESWKREFSLFCPGNEKGHFLSFCENANYTLFFIRTSYFGLRLVFLFSFEKFEPQMFLFCSYFLN